MDAFGFEESAFFGEAAGESSQFTVASNYAVARNSWGVRIDVESSADGAIAVGFQAAGDVSVGHDAAVRDGGGDGPHFLLE